MKCKLCDSEVNQSENPNNCPKCGEKYVTITLTDFQRLVECIQNKQYEIE